MTNSRRSSTSTDDGEQHQFDDYSGPGTNPVGRTHPKYGMLTLPGPSDVGTTNDDQGPADPGSSEVTSSQAPSRTPSDDRLMTEDDIQKAMPKLMEEHIRGRRAAGKTSLWDDGRKSDEEEPEGVPKKSSAVPKIPRRRTTRTTSIQDSRVSKTPRPVPVRSKTNEEPGRMTSSRLQVSGTRSGLRSQTAAQTSRDDEVRISERDTVIGFEDDVDKMSINDQ